MQWSPGGRFVTSCQLDITFYPFDRQQCELDFVDWTVRLTDGSLYVCFITKSIRQPNDKSRLMKD